MRGVNSSLALPGCGSLIECLSLLLKIEGNYDLQWFLLLG
jgi:hypothetical protein